MSSTSWLALTLVFDSPPGWVATCPEDIASRVIDENDYDDSLEAFKQELFTQISLLNDLLDHHMGREVEFEWGCINLGLRFDPNDGIYVLFEAAGQPTDEAGEFADDATEPEYQDGAVEPEFGEGDDAE